MSRVEGIRELSHGAPAGFRTDSALPGDDRSTRLEIVTIKSASVTALSLAVLLTLASGYALALSSAAVTEAADVQPLQVAAWDDDDRDDDDDDHDDEDDDDDDDD